MKKKLICACMGLFCLYDANAQLTQVVDLSTAVYNGTTTIIPANGTNTDDSWSLVSPTTATVYSVTYPSYAPSTNAGWISPEVVNHDGYYDDGVVGHSNGGTYVFQLSFTAPSCTITSATLNLTEMGADNILSSIQINSGTPYSLGGVGFTSLSSTSFSVTGIVAGTNTVRISVVNPTFSQMALLLYGNLTINYAGDPTLVSHITGPSTVCFGDPLTFDGSTSTGTAGDHVWTVVECNSSGVPVSGATTWWSPFIAGNPGSYTLPAAGSGGPTIACNKYYLVKLALQGPCDIWKENTMVVRVNCLPVANAGADQTICIGTCATVGAGKTDLSSTYIWTNSSGYVGTGKSISVCPTVTTTYTVTVTNGTTGCSASDVVTITVISGPACGAIAPIHNNGYKDLAAETENASAELNVYPNPSNGIFTIELNNSVKTNMEIYDMTGKKVKEEQVTGNYTLDLSGYSKGIYMIRMIINDQPVMKKIILE